MDQITRNFKVKRGEFMMDYPFTTFSSIFDDHDGDIGKVMAFLKDVFINGCPERGERVSVSQAKMMVLPNPKAIDTDLIEHARLADYRGKGHQQHPIVQKYLLENDGYTLATEVPLWDEELHGHLDILRVVPEGDKFIFEFVDFKPNAQKEKKAPSQVRRYMELGIKQMGIPREMVRGIYYDDTHAYQVTI